MKSLSMQHKKYLNAVRIQNIKKDIALQRKYVAAAWIRIEKNDNYTNRQIYSMEYEKLLFLYNNLNSLIEPKEVIIIKLLNEDKQSNIISQIPVANSLNSAIS